MKNLRIFLFLVVAQLAVSCSKDDNSTVDAAIDQQQLQGTWNVIGYQIVDGTSTTETSGEKLTQDYTSYGKDYDITVAFNSEPNSITNDGSYTLVSTYSLVEQEYTQEATAYSALEASSWSVTGSQVVLSDNGTDRSASILEASAGKLVLEMDYTKVVEAGSSSKITSTGKLTLTLER